MLPEIILTIALLINTVLNFIIYRHTRERQIYLMEEFWDFEAYIKEWVREELRNQRPNETAAGIIQN